ncbi:FAD-dependent oxidoreductase [Pedobacter hiemivivus]|uniref:FAD-dependent oxidoreductase n=1 Tax=Pedobacter hiemivivus TaxID=2530454 RepID=A0A4R0N0K5_9SPHI|nr:FAD-dependent oxidoreductase [Pedobacter hiemivivus]TCC93165.1 FAD-dependent oxidoreductase [Pedobacter hiemivivus]
MKKIIFSCMFMVLLAINDLSAQIKKYDLVVYGGTASGVMAGYAAAKEGLKVAILTQNKHVGGLTTSGLGNVDKGMDQTIGGYTLDFFKRVGKKYGSDKPAYSLTPLVAEQTFLEMIKESGAEVFYDARLVEKTGVVLKGKKIEKLMLENGQIFSAKVFVDATYEGDLMAWAKVPYIVGRESKAKYNEPQAGRGLRGYKPIKLNSADLNDIKNIAKEFPLDYIFAAVIPQGEGDNKTQAYTFRLTLTAKEGNKVPFKKPSSYNPLRYKSLLKKILREKIVSFDKVCTIYPLPDEKTDINHLDLDNASHQYPDGSYLQRDYIWQYHKDYTEGYLYFVANDPEVPEALRKDAQRYGLAKDEFVDNENWPYLLYTREGRRMLGSYVMVQQDAWENAKKDDVIGMGSYFLDSHEVQKTVTPDNYLISEGGMFYTSYKPYQIPYRSLTSKIEDCENLYVTICMSASHVIYGSLRMEPVFMINGHAVGVAAALTVKNNVPVQKINVKQLQSKLVEQKQIFDVPLDPDTYILKDRFTGLIVDDFEAEKIGKWTWARNQRLVPFMLGGFQLAEQSPTETAAHLYQTTLPKTGSYEVFTMYVASKDRAKKAKIILGTEEGDKVVYVDMTKKPADGYWESLGVFNFKQGTSYRFKISNEGEGGLVAADALRFVMK